MQPPPAAGDAAASRLCLSFGARGPGCPRRWVRVGPPGLGGRRWSGPGARRRLASPRARRRGGAQAAAAAVIGDLRGHRDLGAGSVAGPPPCARTLFRFGPCAGRLPRSRFGLHARDRRGGDCLSRLRVLQEVGVWCLAWLAGCRRDEPLNFSRNACLSASKALRVGRAGWVGEGWPCAPPSAPEGGHWGRRCTQRAAGYLRVGYRYNPLLACLEAWAPGNGTSA